MVFLRIRQKPRYDIVGEASGRGRPIEEDFKVSSSACVLENCSEAAMPRRRAARFFFDAQEWFGWAPQCLGTN